MSSIDGSARISGAVLGLASESGVQPSVLTAGALARLSNRIEAWVQLVASRTKGESDGSVALERLEAGGDVYGLRDLARELGAATGASPTQEGRLLRALEDVARGAALRLFGLAGASEPVRLADIGEAIRAATRDPVGGSASPAEETIQRLETAAKRLDVTGSHAPSGADPIARERYL